MAITPASMGSSVYMMYQKTPPNPTVNGNHIMFDPAHRMNYTCTHKKNKVYDVAFNLDPTGSCYYLPYNWDKICSTILLHTPPANGVRCVFTANLSGCAIFIDRQAVTNNLIFSHANTVGNSPTKLQSETQPSFQTPAANGALTALHGLITNQYPGCVALAELRKPTYGQPSQDEINRKTQAGRSNIICIAGTTVIGFYLPGGWRFYYQTWGFLNYDRPDNLKVKIHLHSKRREGTSNQDETVYGGAFHQFYP